MEGGTTATRSGDPRPTSSDLIRSRLRRPRYLLPAAVLVAVALYLIAVRPFLMESGSTVFVEMSIIVLLLVGFVTASAVALGLLAITGAVTLVPARRSLWRKWFRRSDRAAMTAVLLFVAFGAAALANDALTYALPMRDASGDEIPGSIATLEKVEIGGTTQYITVRATDPDNPVLLFLAGGPGGSELVKTRYGRTGEALEEHFVVVNWDQPGAGKSWNAIDIEDLDPTTYVNHAGELTDQLRERFDRDKIYVMGDSWGSALGLWLVEQQPEKFHAYVGVDQMVAFLENDLLMWDAARQHAERTGDDGRVAALEQTGLPPYLDNPSLQFMPLNMEVGEGMAPYDTSGYDLALANPFAPEYGFVDTVGQVWGLYKTFNQVYPRLYSTDFREDVPELEVPAYFLAGRHDLNAFQSLAEDYYARLDAPHKEFRWFERSGHNVLVEEPEKVENILVERVLDNGYAKE